MKCLVVIAHPDRHSLCHTLAETAIAALREAGNEVLVEDLYQSAFAPALTLAERASYYSGDYAAGALVQQIDRLCSADALVLVFPTWWFGFPAILKGWFDRVWAPGAAYDHADDLGPIKPRLHRLRRTLAITSLGSPWWVDWLLMWRPVYRTLRIALLGTSAPRSRFALLSIYRAERLDAAQVAAFRRRVARTLANWR